MIKVLIFVAGRDIHNLNLALQKLNSLFPRVELQILGSTGVYPMSNVPYISINNISNVEFDFLLVTGGSDDINGPAADVHFADILSELRKLNIPESKVILDRVLCIPGFTFDKYEKLKKSKPTIFAMNCFGGVIYHRFGLPFQSPMINMFLSDVDMIKFLKNPISYMNSDLQFHAWNSNGGGGGIRNLN